MTAGGSTISVACWKRSVVGTAAVQEVYDACRMALLQGLCFSTSGRLGGHDQFFFHDFCQP